MPESRDRVESARAVIVGLLTVVLVPGAVVAAAGFFFGIVALVVCVRHPSANGFASWATVAGSWSSVAVWFLLFHLRQWLSRSAGCGYLLDLRRRPVEASSALGSDLPPSSARRTWADFGRLNQHAITVFVVLYGIWWLVKWWGGAGPGP